MRAHTLLTGPPGDPPSRQMASMQERLQEQLCVFRLHKPSNRCKHRKRRVRAGGDGLCPHRGPVSWRRSVVGSHPTAPQPRAKEAPSTAEDQGPQGTPRARLAARFGERPKLRSLGARGSRRVLNPLQYKATPTCGSGRKPAGEVDARHIKPHSAAQCWRAHTMSSAWRHGRPGG